MRKIFLFIAALCCSAAMFAQDTREVVNALVFTGTPTFEYGALVNTNEIFGTFEAPDGAPYYISAVMSNPYKKDIPDDVRMNYGATILEGTYYYYMQVRIDGSFGSTHRLQDDGSLTCKVNGVDWTVGTAHVYETYSYVYVQGPDFVVEKTVLPFQFNFSTDLDYNKTFQGTAIEEKDLKAYTLGGTETYSYSKLSNHISWLNVSADGIISGTPGALSNVAQKDTIRVTDGVDADTFAITVYEVRMDPAAREIVSDVVFTGTPDVKLGTVVNISTIFNSFVAPVDAPYYMSKVMANLYKKALPDDIELVNGDVVTEGTYYYYAQVRIDGDFGKTHRLQNDGTLTCKVNGEDWTIGTTIYVSDTYSYVYVQGPDFVISSGTALDNASANAKAVKRIVNGQLFIERDGKTFNAQGIEVK